jgi:hypothetical protein
MIMPKDQSLREYAVGIRNRIIKGERLWVNGISTQPRKSSLPVG